MNNLSNLPPGCSDADIERHANGSGPCWTKAGRWQGWIWEAADPGVLWFHSDHWSYRLADEARTECLDIGQAALIVDSFDRKTR